MIWDIHLFLSLYSIVIRVLNAWLECSSTSVVLYISLYKSPRGVKLEEGVVLLLLASSLVSLPKAIYRSYNSLESRNAVLW